MDNFDREGRVLSRVPRIKRRKRLLRMYVTRHAQSHRNEHTLGTLCVILLLWRDLEGFGFETSKRQIERRILRSFCFLLMEKTRPEDIELIEYLLERQTHSATPIYGMLRIRMIDLMVDHSELVRPKIRDTSAKSRATDSLLEVRSEIVENLASEYPLKRLLVRSCDSLDDVRIAA